jgi:hypothetical protein
MFLSVCGGDAAHDMMGEPARPGQARSFLLPASGSEGLMVLPLAILSVARVTSQRLDNAIVIPAGPRSDPLR